MIKATINDLHNSNFWKQLKRQLKLFRMQHHFNQIEHLNYLMILLEMNADRAQIENSLSLSLVEIEKLISNDKGDQRLIQDISILCSKRDRILWVLKHRIQTKHFKSTLIKLMLYPTFLFFSSLMMLTLLYASLIPETYSRLQIGTSSQFFWIQFVIGLMWAVIILSLGSGLLLYKEKQVSTYRWIYEHFPQHLWVKWESLTFITHLIYALEFGIKLPDFVRLFKREQADIFYYLVNVMLKRFEQGKSKEALFYGLDQNLIKILSLDDYDRSFIQRLKQNQHLLKHDITYRMSRLVTQFKVFVYIQCSVLILGMYQMTLSPLKHLEKLL